VGDVKIVVDELQLVGSLADVAGLKNASVKYREAFCFWRGKEGALKPSKF
jgi:hypothetical protein